MNNWEQKIKDLERTPYGILRLIADGYNLSIQPVISNRRIVLQWFVDGVWKGEYCNRNNEIGAKFGHPKYYRPKKKDIEFAKLLHRIRERTKFDVKKFKLEHTRVLFYVNYHPSAASLIRTLKKNCKEILLVE